MFCVHPQEGRREQARDEGKNQQRQRREGAASCVGKLCLLESEHLCEQIHLVVKLSFMMPWIQIDSCHDSEEEQVYSFLNNVSLLHLLLSCCLI